MQNKPLKIGTRLYFAITTLFLQSHTGQKQQHVICEDMRRVSFLHELLLKTYCGFAVIVSEILLYFNGSGESVVKRARDRWRRV